MKNLSKILCAFLLCVEIGFLTAADPSKYIWNIGLAALCDVTPFKKGEEIINYSTSPSLHWVYPAAYVKDVQEGDVIWVQTHQLRSFIANELPKINNRFILLINDGDNSFPSAYGNIDDLILDDRVIHIFAQNVNAPNYLGKVTCAPIGIDFHTVAHQYYCRYFGESFQTPKQQEAYLDALLSTLLPTYERKKKAYVDFQLADRGSYDGESRSSIFNYIYPTGLIDAPNGRVPRHVLWETKGQYAFSISPRGAGLDCHRTWEDLVLGCIVIVKTSPLDCLYEGLPVVIVKDWSEINEANFDKWLLEYGDAFTNPDYREKLTLQYWMNIIRAKKTLL